MSNSIVDLTPAQLRRAAEIKEKIAALQTELSRLLEGAKPSTAKGGKQSKMSPAARAKIGAAQKKIWAKRKANARKTDKTGKAQK